MMKLRRRGMVAVTAVTMLAMAGVTIAAMGSLFAAEARRTRDAADEAQLRQLLLAGGSVANRRVETGTPMAGEMKIELPPSLAGSGALLVLRIAGAPDANSTSIAVDAALGERSMSQTLRYERRDGRWRLASATLGP